MLLLAIPLPIAGLSYVVFVNSTTLDYFTPAFVPVVFMMLHVPVATIALLFIDWRWRRRTAGRRHRVSAWVSTVLILLMGAASTGPVLYVIDLWVAAMASV